MTLAADHDFSVFHDPADRRGTAREPRRSWASSEPFEQRRTVRDADDSAHGWRSVGSRYGHAAVASDAAIAVLVTGITLARSYDLRTSLDALLAGRPVPAPETEALGCYIADPAAIRGK